MGHNLSKPLSLKGFWVLITMRHHHLLETLKNLSLEGRDSEELSSRRRIFSSALDAKFAAVEWADRGCHRNCRKHNNHPAWVLAPYHTGDTARELHRHEWAWKPPSGCDNWGRLVCQD